MMAHSPSSHSPFERELDFSAAKMVQSIASTTAANFFARFTAGNAIARQPQISPNMGNIDPGLLPGSPDEFGDDDEQVEAVCGLPNAHAAAAAAAAAGGRSPSAAARAMDNGPAAGAGAGSAGNTEGSVLPQATRPRTAEQEEILYIQRLCQMEPGELEAEKKRVKTELKAFDEEFFRSHRRPPGKAEKETIRPKYELYNDIKLLLVNANMGTDKENGGGGRPQESPISLEKKLLQRRLRRFESQFEAREGRKVKYHKDIATVRATYQRYKNLKRILQNE